MAPYKIKSTLLNLALKALPTLSPLTVKPHAPHSLVKSDPHRSSSGLSLFLNILPPHLCPLYFIMTQIYSDCVLFFPKIHVK